MAYEDLKQVESFPNISAHIAADETYQASSQSGNLGSDIDWIRSERARRGLPSGKAVLRQHWNSAEFAAEPTVMEFDIQKLTSSERQLVLDAALQTRDMDNLLLLSKVQQRFSRVGLLPPENEVRFENLSVQVEATPVQNSLPSIPGAYVNFFQDCARKLHLRPGGRQHLEILKDVSGVVRPGRLTLLLGPPGGGRSTLLKALAGRLKGSSLKQLGKVTYNGHNLDEFVVERTSSYVDQHDNHIAELTVRETFDFAARCLNAGLGADSMAELRRREKEQGLEPDWEIDAFMRASALHNKRQHIMTDYMLRLLGLEVCADVRVGNSMVRGISGGQRKRTTIGEMVIGPKRTLFMDEISTGLDASTTLQIVRSMRNLVVLRKCTIMMALLQPARETYDLFDDVILLAAGRIVYQGPREDVLAFFESQAFRCPPRKGVADFLQEICSLNDQEQYWADQSRSWAFVRPEELADAFHASQWGQQQAAALAEPVQRSSEGAAAVVRHRYALGGASCIAAVMQREALLMRRNSLIYVLRFVQLFTMSFMSATLFVKTRMSRDHITEGQHYIAYLFFASFTLTVNGFSELPLTVQSLSVFYKQRDELFYPVYAYLLPLLVLRLPVSVLTTVLWHALTYFSIGLSPSPGRFFIMTVTGLALHQASMSMFRAVATIGRHPVVSSALGFLLITAAILFNGYVIAERDLPGWWIWGLWANSGSWGMRSFAIDECLAPEWGKPSGVPGQTVGEAVLAGIGLLYPFKWVWIDLGALVALFWAWNGVTYLAMLLLGEPNERKAILKPERQNMLSSHTSFPDSSCNTPVHIAVDMPLSPLPAGSKPAPIVPSTQATAGQAVKHNKADLRHSSVIRQSSSSSVGSQDIAAELEQVAQARHTRPGVSHMNRPFQPMLLTFTDVHYWVPSTMAQQATQKLLNQALKGSEGDEQSGLKTASAYKEIELLKGISGAFCPGVLTALMGASGAGKTTLLDVLACRKTFGRSTGDVRVNGFPQDAGAFARITGYVEQEDIHSPQTTVREALAFSGRLRQPASVDQATLERFVDEMLELVELVELRNGLVGLPGVSGLSVEQRKRLSIAVELVANPAIVFMDEPTSGLDARAAAIVVRTLRRITETGRTITATVHQPATDVFESFDELLLLERGGRMIYAGPLGTQSSHMVAYFEGLPGVPRIQEGFNPSTWMLEISTLTAELRRKQGLADSWSRSHLFGVHMEKVQELSQPQAGAQPLHFDDTYAMPFWRQYCTVLKKFLICYWRYPQYNSVRLTTTVVLAVIFGSVCWQRGMQRSTEQGVRRIAGLQFLAVINMGYNNAFVVLPILAVERGVFYRERAAHYYSSIPYALAQADVEVPFVFVQSLLYSVIVYFMVHLEMTAVKFLWFFLFMFLTLAMYTFLGIVLMALAPSAPAASVSSVTLLAAWALFAGFVAPKPTIPGYWIWFYWLSPTAHALYGLTASQQGDVTDEYLTPLGEAPVSVAEYVREYYGFEHSFTGYAALVLCGFIIVCRVTSLLALRYINWQKR